MIPIQPLVQPSILDITTGYYRTLEALPLFSPVRLQAIAHLYGVEAAPLATARVLEIGCNSSQQLLLFAQAYPHAQTIGVCGSGTEQETAEVNAHQAGVSNAQFITLSLDQINTQLGSFDYIIVRNQYSALHPEAAQLLLQITQALLSDRGLACIDYDIYPGAKVQESIRDAMLIHCGGADANQTKDLANTALTLFKSGRAQQGPLTKALLDSAQRLQAKLDAEGVHSVLAPQGTPCYFIEFADYATQAGLACIGDAEPQLDITMLYAGELPLINTMLTLGKPPAMKLQYLDFSTGRSVRSTLLTRLSRKTGILVKPKLELLQQLRWAGAFKRAEGRIEKTGRTVFIDYVNRQLISTSAVMTAILDTLAHVWPSTLPFASLANIETIKTAFLQDGNTEKSIIDIIAAVIEQLFCNNALYYCLEPGPYDQPLSAGMPAKPSSQLQRLQVSKGEFPDNKKLTLYNLWCEPLDSEWSTPEQFAITTLGKKGGFTTDTLAPNETTFINNNQNNSDIKIGNEVFTKTGTFIPPTLVERLHWLGLIQVNFEPWLEMLHEILDSDHRNEGYWSLLLSALTRQSIQNTELPAWNKNISTNPALTTLPPQVASQVEKVHTLLGQGAYDQVVLMATQLLKRYPGLQAAKIALSDAFMLNGNNQSALRQLLTMSHLLTTNSKALRILARALLNTAQYNGAITAARKLLELNPNDIDGYLVLDNCYIQLARFTEAEIYSRKVITLLPNNTAGHMNLSRSLCELGKPDEAVELLSDCLKKEPDAYHLYPNLLYAVNYSTEKTAEEIFNVYQDFDENACQIQRKTWRSHKNNRNINRKIKIAYVSADFRNHAVAKFLEPLLEHHDKSRFEVTAYANQTIEDHVTKRFQHHVDCWVPVYGLSDDALADRIRADQIDILVDVSGHTSGNRLMVFARKPAPISLSWMGFGYTTGVSAIDYFLGDNDLCPPESEHLFAEQPWRLPITNYIYRTDMDSAGPVGELPAKKQGYITLGSLSRSLRINAELISVWAKILHALPKARLVLNSRSYADLLAQEKLINEFSAHGIEPRQLLLGYTSPPWDALRSIDIGLDCFPHNSGTTLFDMLSMGVPYVTLAGRPSVGRLGSSILRGVGHPEWIANSTEEYIEKVIALANDLSKLEDVRMTLRDDLKQSSMMDEPGFARIVEDAYQEMFKKWANRKN